jgi:malate dehydrogenase
MNRVKVTVTGGAGQICYNLLFRIGSGEVFGKNTLVDLVILEIPSSMKELLGVKMEIDDCAFKSLSSVTTTDSIDEAFDGIDYAFLVGAKPRSKGMERSDLLKENGKIFLTQGKALNRSPGAKVLVIGNPCNTNALILMHAAKNLDPFNIRAMTRLDQNRAVSMIAKKAKVGVEDVKNVTIFGNHSSTMVIDYLHGTVKGKSIENVIGDKNWLQGEMFSSVQKRGAAILEARGLSSAASAANAGVDAMKDWMGGGKENYTSAGIYAKNNPYGIFEDLYFSFPLKGGKIVEGLKMDLFLEEKIKLTEQELLDERDAVKEYLR